MALSGNDRARLSAVLDQEESPPPFSAGGRSCGRSIRQHFPSYRPFQGSLALGDGEVSGMMTIKEFSALKSS